jgi:anti-anti-sigma factor
MTMTIVERGGVLNVSDVEDLDAAHAGVFQTEVTAALAPNIQRIEIDLSRTGRVDCGGVGALIALRKCARQCNSNVNLRVRNPTQTARRVLHLTRLDDLLPMDGEENPLPLATGQTGNRPEALSRI